MTSQGYMRFPTIYRDRIVFVAEDDLWLVSSEGGRAERLTAGVGEISYPFFSTDGTQLAFIGKEEGPAEVYTMSALGGEARRLTFQGVSRVAGWSPTAGTIIFASDVGCAHIGEQMLYAISPTGGEARLLPLGLANTIADGPRHGVVLGRNIGEPARWKRYRGGTTGYLWCDAKGNGQFQ